MIKAEIKILPASNEPDTAQQSGSCDSSTTKASKWDVVVALGWLPLTVIASYLLQTCFKYQIFIMKEEEQGRFLSIYSVLMGFYIGARYVFYQLRDSESLKEFRSTMSWRTAVFCSYVGFLLLVVSVVLGSVNYLLSQPSILLYSVELALYLTAIVYGVVEFFFSSKALRQI